MLPFKNLSDSKEDEYFSDGITEDIIARLSKIRNLKVISRTSMMRYKTSDKSIPEICQELKVATALEGSVRRSGSRLRIVSQLIDAQSDEHLWAESYDRKMEDIFEIQKGRYFWNKRSEEGVNKSIEYFQQAIEKDSTYALAYAGLGDSYLMLGVYGRQRPGESFPLAKTYVNRALRLDSGLAEAYATLGDINIHFDWDLDAAEANLRRAIELNPQYASGFHWYSEVFVLRGEFERAYQESRRALELDPYSLIINTQLGQHYRRTGEFQKAIDQLRKTIEFDSTFAYGHYDLGIVYVALKQLDRAVYNLRKANALAPSDTRILAGLAFAEGFARNKDEAQRIEKALLERAAREYVPPHDLAIVSLSLGKTERALEYLDQAYDDHAPGCLS